jgi:hypothetical protein
MAALLTEQPGHHHNPVCLSAMAAESPKTAGKSRTGIDPTGNEPVRDAE